MVQGTASDVGKSVVATALCRIFARAGQRVAPFKAQNMSLNAAVTADGGEIGRAQAAQAEAAGVPPHVDMNPILLKPESDRRAQLVVRGRAVGRLDWTAYRAMAPELRTVVAASLARLRASHDVVVIEGAGNPAEPNFRDDEIVNMAVARLTGAPVLLVGDIDRGGVFAAFVGTLALLPDDDRVRVAGFVVNKFRGDPALLAPALADVEARTGVPVLGVIPYLADVGVPAEDSCDIGVLEHPADSEALNLGLIRLPHIANFDDFEPLAEEPGVRVRLVDGPVAAPGCDALVLPGSKSTVADLAWLQARGLDRAVSDFARRGGAVLGVCGGYQMLGDVVRDPAGVESETAEAAGLGLLPGVTCFARAKRTVRVRARVATDRGAFGSAAGADFDAYEIHAGRTDAGGDGAPFEVIAPERRMDGAQRDGVVGTYLHGLFEHGGVRRAFLTWVAGRARRNPCADWGGDRPRTRRWDALADAVSAALDLGAVGRLVGVDLR